MSKKITDSNIEVSDGSRADRYWRESGFAKLYPKFRSPVLKSFQEKEINPYDYLVKTAKFKALEFGNWVNSNYRFNYAVAACVALHDINKVLRFDMDLGFKCISLAFGARGSGRAMAHYEPDTGVINITRFPARDYEGDGLFTSAKKVYIAGEENQNELFLTSGGVGALAHEYGHALDYHFGTYVEPAKPGLPNEGHRSLTKGWRTTGTSNPEDFKPGTMRGQMNKIIFTLIQKPDGEHTDYYAKLYKRYYGKNNYWLRHNELFARVFEQYIQYKLEAMAINNRFLTQRKYMATAYADPKLLKKVVPMLDELITMMRKKKKDCPEG